MSIMTLSDTDRDEISATQLCVGDDETLVHLQQIGDLLSETDFPRVGKKPQTKKSYNQILHLGSIHRPFHGYIECVANNRNKMLFTMLKQLMNGIDPNFKYSTITINKNVKCAPHRDEANRGKTWILALGDFEGGELVIEGAKIQIKESPTCFNGSCYKHWNNDWTGDRYSIMFYQMKDSPPIVYGE